MPRKAYFDDAGYDFLCPEHIEIPADGYAIIDLKVCVQIPIGFYGKMESKSGLMMKHHIVCLGGVINSSYRGSVRVLIENHGEDAYCFEPGEKVVQMIVQPCLLATLEQVEELDESTSGRGEGGFGSTGK